MHSRPTLISLCVASALLAACGGDELPPVSTASGSGTDSLGESGEEEAGSASESGSESESESGTTGTGTGGDENVLPDTDPDCWEETFLDPSLFQNPGGSSFSPDYAVTCDGGTMTVNGNNIPTYAFTQTTPNALAEAQTSHAIPLVPTWLDVPAQSTTLGTIGVSVGGLNLQTPSEAADLGYGDPVYDNALDFCLGHTGFGGAYHNHALVGTCLFTSDDGSARSPILGWAYDGYPIFGTMGCLDEACDTPVEMQSSYNQLNDPTDCVDQSFEYAGDPDESSDGDAFLDECNGHFGPAGDYHYHATTTYPYLLGCFHGQPSSSAVLYGGGMDAMMESNCTDGVCDGPDCGAMPPMP